MLVSGGSFALEGRMLDWSFVEGIPEDGKGKRGEVGGRSAVFHSRSRGGLGGGDPGYMAAVCLDPAPALAHGKWHVDENVGKMHPALGGHCADGGQYAHGNRVLRCSLCIPEDHCLRGTSKGTQAHAERWGPTNACHQEASWRSKYDPGLDDESDLTPGILPVHPWLGYAPLLGWVPPSQGPPGPGGVDRELAGWQLANIPAHAQPWDPRCHTSC